MENTIVRPIKEEDYVKITTRERITWTNSL